MTPCLAAEPSSDLNEALIGFGSAIAEKNLPRSRDLDQPLSQGDLRLRAIQVGRVNELRRLRTHGGGDFGMRMAQRANRNAGSEIEIFRSVRSPGSATRTTFQVQVESTIARNDVTSVFF